MYTLEREEDWDVIRSLDETGTYEDIEVFVEDKDPIERVFIRQYVPKSNEHQVIAMSYSQINDIFLALTNQGEPLNEFPNSSV